MSVYNPLADYLNRTGSDSVPMTFGEIEALIGRKLPPSAYRHRPWWANEPRGHSHAKAWLDAGFETEQVDMESRKLIFRRAATSPSSRGMTDVVREFTHMENTGAKKLGRHPALGSMKGTFTIEPGYDLTSPMFTDEEWAEIEKQMDEDWDQIEQGMTKSK
ncbi:MAG: hypothetical protein JO208_08465 [Alphaproteobacteria bacterium]|nr:hypothetical protein [Alphaproteobacteria bacterium]